MAKIEFNPSQKQIIEHREGNMIVSASAGSGKTTVMLERVLQIIEEGTPIDRIVILAFNNSIAAEIRGKMYKKLTARINEPDCTKKDFLKEQIDRLPFCNIITNDSYCNRTSSEFFQILGIDPNADINSEVDKNILFYNSFNKALSEMKEEPNGNIFELSLKFGGEDKLFNEINSIHNYVSTQAGGMEWLERVVGGVYTEDITKSSIMTFLFEMVASRIKYILNLLDSIIEIAKGYPDLQERYITSKNFFEELLGIKDYEKFYILINSFEPANKQRQSKKYDIDWALYKSNSDDIKGSVEWLKGMFKNNLKYVQSVHKFTIKDIKLLVELYKKTRDNYDQEKAKNSKYDFTDFSSNLIKLLNSTDIQREIAKRYDYICVDEYQDTNYAQEEIYTKISNGNNLFMVGDSKQSIYRFRLSEPKILLEKFNNYNEGLEQGKTIKLDNNYRSDRGVVEFVNAVFDEIMTVDFGGIDYKNTDQLRYGADYKVPPTNPTYEIHIYEENKEKEKIEKKSFDKVYSVKDDICDSSNISLAYREGLFIAKRIKEIKDSYKIYDPEIKDTRNVQYSDIAVLARTGKDSVREIVKAIQDKQIPIDVAPLLKEDGIYEVEIIKDILRLIVCDTQDYPLAAALVSYWVDMDYDDLLEIRAKVQKTDYFWQAVKEQAQENANIKKLYSMLNDLRIKASYMSIKELADCIVYDYGYDQYLLKQIGGDYKLSAVQTYLATLGELSSDCSLRDYVSNLSGGKMEIKGSAGGNTVKAMTIHKSKGLEFPIVFVCNIDEGLTKGGGFLPKMQINKDAGIAINYFDENAMIAKSNLAFDILAEKNKLENKAEAMRVFYVALTRPKNHIILTGCKGSGDLAPKSPFKADSFLDWIMIAANKNSKVQNAITYHNDDDDQRRPNMELYTFQNSDKVMPIIDKYVNFEYPNKNALNTSIKYTVTEINKQGGNFESVFEAEEIDISDDLDKTTFDRTRRGTNYHAVLENIDFNARSVQEVSLEIKRLVSCGKITSEEAFEIDEAEILAVLNSEVIEYARQNKCYREQEFTLLANASEVMDTNVCDKVIVNGAIDLLIMGEQVWIVDYKKTDESTAVLKKRYKKQLNLYAKAVEKGFGRKVDRAVLFVIGRNEIVDIDLTYQQ